MRQDRLVKELQADPRAYIESVGKYDRQTVIDALHDGGESTALRVGIGVSTQEVPLRTMSYVASILAVQELYLPKAQVQLIYPIFAAHQSNKVSLENAGQQAADISGTAMGLFGRHDLERYRSRLTSLFDTPIRGDDGLSDRVAEVLTGQDNAIEKLEAAATRRLGNAARYVAAHLRVHDTVGEFIVMADDMYDPPIAAERVISVGAQSERVFYAARMMCREAGVLPPGSTHTQTGQLFTKHVLPPYQPSKHGEPALTNDHDLERYLMGAGILPTDKCVASVARDLIYLRSEAMRVGAFSLSGSSFPFYLNG